MFNVHRSYPQYLLLYTWKRGQFFRFHIGMSRLVSSAPTSIEPYRWAKRVLMTFYRVSIFTCIFNIPWHEHTHIHIQTTPHRTQINTFIIWIVLMNYLSMTHNSVIDFRVLFASRFYTQFLSLDFPWFFFVLSHSLCFSFECSISPRPQLPHQ